MKKLLPIFILVFSFSAFAQKKIAAPKIKVKKTIESIEVDILAARNPKDYFLYYDKFDDRTTVYCTADEMLVFYFTFNGKTLLTQPKVFNVRAETRLINNDYKPLLKNDFMTYRSLILLIDDERMTFNGTYLFKEDRQMLFFTISQQILEKIINAGKVEYRVGKYESLFYGFQRDRLKLLTALATPY